MAQSVSQDQEKSLTDNPPSEVSREEEATTDPQGPVEAVAESGSSEETGSRFIGQWNQLVSTTNWEKGQIICDWREALIESGAAVTDYSDEAWAQLVGNVTSQHVGRLRRVTQRFTEGRSQYAGLYWSHFQAALDWDDSEMWLEGAIQNKWSVSQMRGKRWETLDMSPEEQRSEVAVEMAEMDEDGKTEGADEMMASAVAPSTKEAPSTTSPTKTDDGESSGAASKTEGDESDEESSPAEQAAQIAKRTPLSVDVEKLPDDLAEAFESFKLAIIAHRREGWTDTTPEMVVECLDGLRELALANDAE